VVPAQAVRYAFRRHPSRWVGEDGLDIGLCLRCSNELGDWGWQLAGGEQADCGRSDEVVGRGRHCVRRYLPFISEYKTLCTPITFCFYRFTRLPLYSSEIVPRNFAYKAKPAWRILQKNKGLAFNGTQTMWNPPRGLAHYIVQTRNSPFTAVTAAGDQLNRHTHSLSNIELCKLWQCIVTG
jgi:hypothetical protein